LSLDYITQNSLSPLSALTLSRRLTNSAYIMTFISEMDFIPLIFIL